MKKKSLAILIASLVIVSVGSAGITYVFLNPAVNIVNDTANPVVNIISPINTVYNEKVFLFEISAEDDYIIDSIWYNWRGENVTYVAPYYITFDEGVNTIQAWANDSKGNIGSDSVTFTVDINDPTVQINHPMNSAYSDPVQILNVTVTDDLEIDKIWFNWNLGTDTFYESPINVTFSDGLNVMNVFANDTAGNIFQDTVSFTIANVFTTVWDTSQTSLGSTSINKVKLPLESSGTYDFTVLWGDGSSDHITGWDQPDVTHSYDTIGDFEVKIYGTLVGWKFGNSGDKSKITEIKNWGSLQLGNSGGYFAGCDNLEINVQDVLNLNGTTILESAFAGCEKIDYVENMNDWDTSNVNDTRWMFSTALKFNQDISNWNVSKVTDMKSMFFGAVSFNKTLNDWDTSSVTDMNSMFQFTYSFGQTLENWDTSSVTDMNHMFYNSAFNQTLEDWDTSKVTDMSFMFYMAVNFNQNLTNWDVSSVTTVESMFEEAWVFNGNLNGWNVSNVTTMKNLFRRAFKFNQTLSNWNVSRVTDMNGMFSNAEDFDQNISTWNVSAVTTMVYFFYQISLSTPNYDALLIEWSLLTLQSDITFTAGNSKYSAGAATDARLVLTVTYGWFIDDGGQA
jgi:surface protein